MLRHVWLKNILTHVKVTVRVNLKSQMCKLDQSQTVFWKSVNIFLSRVSEIAQNPDKTGLISQKKRGEFARTRQSKEQLACVCAASVCFLPDSEDVGLNIPSWLLYSQISINRESNSRLVQSLVPFILCKIGILLRT